MRPACFTQSYQADCSSSGAYYNADGQQQYGQDGAYYDNGQQGYQDEYYNDQYYDQGAPAAGHQPQYNQPQA